MLHSFRFDRFLLDSSNRQLSRDGAPVELNARYLDALTLLVREQGKLVSKERFLAEVWAGVPVTDEALTQCIKTLRRQLGDDAASPRFIETVPKHGYRFIAPVSEGGGAPTPAATSPIAWPKVLIIGGAGTLGGGVAGLFGGLFYGSFALAPGMGAASMLLVLICLTAAIGLVGAAGVAFGIAAFASRRSALWTVAGGALGGFLVGAVVKLVGLDAFNLLFGQAPADITGGPEGALLGAAVGLGAWTAAAQSFRRGVAIASAIGAVAGVLIHVLGGRLMAGSLASLSARFPDSSLRLDQVGRLFGEQSFGPLSQAFIGAVEGALFASCVVGAMMLARRRWD